jgi:hypothetical protein
VLLTNRKSSTLHWNMATVDRNKQTTQDRLTELLWLPFSWPQ